MNKSILFVVILAVFMPCAYADNYDAQSVNSHYDQYSPANLNNPYSQYEIQYSPSNLSNPYSYESQFSPQKINIPSIQGAHDYHINIISPPAKGNPAVGAKKESPAEAYLLSLLRDKDKPKKNIPLFFYLSLLAFLALLVTISVIIGIFKK
jgi:hypothetical protein